MAKFTIYYCTPNQTKRAYELGAPIEYAKVIDTIEGNSVRLPDDRGEFFLIPTVEQMRGWLREECGIQVFVSTLVGNTASLYVKGDFTMFNVNDCDGMPKNFDTYGQAILAAIDAALDYLEKRKEAQD